MFTATYPARFLHAEGSKGFHARFPDLPEARARDGKKIVISFDDAA